MARAFGGAELAERFGFNLPYALAGYVEFLADFFQRMLALAADAEAQADHLLLLGRKRPEDVAVSSRTLVSITVSTGEPTQRSSIKSPSADSPSRPTGVSSETGSREMVLSFCTFSTGMSMRREISSLLGAAYAENSFAFFGSLRLWRTLSGHRAF